jgi:hypothetical protein
MKITPGIKNPISYEKLLSHLQNLFLKFDERLQSER